MGKRETVFMDSKSLFIGVFIGVLLLPTLFLVGGRIFLWLLQRKVRSVVRNLEAQGFGGPQGAGQGFAGGLFQMQTALQEGPSFADLQQQLQENFLAKTSLSPQEWEQVRDRVAFVHDGLDEEELLSLGFSQLAPTGTARERVKGRGTYLGSLQQPVEADVYVIDEDECPTVIEAN